MRIVRWLLVVAAVAGVVRAEELELTESGLPVGVVARIDDWSIPAEWFKHEFRSTFYRYPPSDVLRESVFEPFLKRMVLTAKAREMGLDQREPLRSERLEKLAERRAFMEYQLAMAEIQMLNEALLKELGLAEDPEELSEKDVKTFFDDHLKGLPGVPASFDLAPDSARAMVRQQAAQARLEGKLDAMIRSWRETMTIEVNEGVVRSVPMPNLQGDLPPGYQPKTSD
ncbi:MAG TPA: hypothetical protein PKE26_07980 [Kiritimatiellia bacterium]|nr:hypothetical protein [Kiritimatiellia bacterium]